MASIFDSRLRINFFLSKKTEVRHQTRDMVQLVECLPRVQKGLGLKLRAK